MSKVSMVATFSCADGKADEMDAVLTAQVAAVAELDGVEVYSYHRGEGNEFSFFALFSSIEAPQGQGEADSLKDVRPAFMRLLASPPQSRRTPRSPRPASTSEEPYVHQRWVSWRLVTSAHRTRVRSFVPLPAAQAPS